MRTPNEASACEEAGIDILVAADLHVGRSNIIVIRKAAPNTFLTIGLAINVYVEHAEVMRNAYRLMGTCAETLNCEYGISTIKALADEYVPVVGHFGLVPYRNSWLGGMKAVGKTSAEALRVYELTKQYEDAGAVGVEMELVPAEVAAEIPKRTKMPIIGLVPASIVMCNIYLQLIFLAATRDMFRVTRRVIEMLRVNIIACTVSLYLHLRDFEAT